MIGVTPCAAQFGGGTPGGTSGIDAAAKRNVRASERTEKPAVPAPPVLPGTKGASEAAAPTTLPSLLSPTEALFDAINRGDVPASRDAVNRGGNLDAQNSLGLTPLELSVDLGRNDISFLLLSMRGEDQTTRRQARGEPDRRISETPRAAGRQHVAAARGREERVRVPEERVAATPRLYSGNGGAAIPAAGFVGFDGGRSVR
jgi:hypothetical protein